MPHWDVLRHVITLAKARELRGRLGGENLLVRSPFRLREFRRRAQGNLGC